MFVSVLQHGNEDSGLLAIQQLLKNFQGKILPRDLVIFVGNVEAAEANLRRLEDQPDYNRVWPDCTEQNDLTRMMQDIYDEMKVRNVFLSVDIHNNTGYNPHYACVNKIDPKFFYLASKFSEICVYFTEPTCVQSVAFSQLCPAVTLECGKAGDAEGVDRALSFLHDCMLLEDWSDHSNIGKIDVFHTVAVVKVPEEVSFGFQHPQAEIDFIADLDHLNFRDLKKGTLLASIRGDEPVPVIVTEVESDAVVTRKYFTCENHQLKLNKPMILAMLTLDSTVIRQDCLCYIMEHYPIPDFW
jgi:succinylglutamate desuccinylase